MKCIHLMSADEQLHQFRFHKYTSTNNNCFFFFLYLQNAYIWVGIFIYFMISPPPPIHSAQYFNKFISLLCFIDLTSLLDKLMFQRINLLIYWNKDNMYWSEWRKATTWAHAHTHTSYLFTHNLQQVLEANFQLQNTL